MTTRHLAVAALMLLAGAANISLAQEQTADGQCNCPKCQAARQAAAENNETLAAMPAGLFSSEPSGLFAPTAGALVGSAANNGATAKSPAKNAVLPAGHTAAAIAANAQASHQQGPSYVGPGPGSHGRRSGASSYGSGTFPYGSQYDHLHAGKPFDGGRYGYFGGAHRTPGYPHHHHHREFVGPQGPPTAHVAYPYYTVRGPRDFFMDNPPSIGR